MSPDIDTRVRAANPVRDEQLEQLFGDDTSARLLREIRDRRVVPMRTSDDTDRQFEIPTPPETPWWRRGWVAALSAAAVVLLIIGVVALVQSDNDPPVGGEAPATTTAPATTAPESAATVAPDPVDPIAVVMSSIDAYNAGDAEEWLSHFSEDATIAGFRRADAAAAFAPVFAANAVRTTAEPCRVVETGADGSSTVECDHVEVNDFNGPAGFVHPDTAAYSVDADGLIGFYSVPTSVDYRAVTRYETGFWFWLEETHPDVFARIESELVATGQSPPGAGGKFPETVADMELSLQYVDEFVAQSDAYPIDRAGEQALAVVLSSIDAYNAGDMEAWLDHFTQDAAIFGASRLTATAEHAPWLAAGSQFTITEPCSPDGLSSDGQPVIDCRIDETNAFHGPGGITNSLAATFTVSEEGISLAAPADFGWANWSRFNSRFWVWLEQAHPDVFDEIELTVGASGTDNSNQRMPQTAEAMAIALQFVDEFVAQSDEYPIVAEE